MKKIVIVSLIVFLLGYSYVWADEVFTHDGRRFQGVISEEGEDYYMMKTKEGTIILNKSDILHLERHEDNKEHVEERDNFITKTIKYFKQLPKNDWYIVRVSLLRIHTYIFSFLEKNRIYRYFADKKMAQKFRRQNFKYYYFAVYMLLFITISVCFSIIKGSIFFIFRKMFGVRKRYDM